MKFLFVVTQKLFLTCSCEEIPATSVDDDVLGLVTSKFPTCEGNFPDGIVGFGRRVRAGTMPETA